MNIEIKQGDSFRIETSEIELLKKVCQKEGLPFRGVYNEATQIAAFPPTHVGYLKLKDRSIFISPRFSSFTLNDVYLLYLVNIDFNLSEGLIEAFSSLLSGKDNTKYLSQVFVNELRKLVKKGIPLVFEEQSQTTNYVQGRVDWLSTKRNITARKQFPIATSLPLVIPNKLTTQLFLQALEKTKHNIAVSDYLSIRSRLPGKIINDSSLIKKIHIDRSNISASKCIELAKAILLDLVPSQISGNQYGEAFLINYDLLFQDFISKVLMNSKFGNDYSRKNDQILYAEFAIESTQFEKNYIPDIFYKPTFTAINNSAEGVIDVKNKFPLIFSNPDVFQTLFYCNQLETKKGILVYPSDREMNAIELKFNDKVSVNLNAVFFNIKSLQSGSFLHEFERFTSEVNSLMS